MHGGVVLWGPAFLAVRQSFVNTSLTWRQGSSLFQVAETESNWLKQNCVYQLLSWKRWLLAGLNPEILKLSVGR